MYLTVIGLTFRMAAVVTLICLLIGYPLAYVLASIKPRLARLLIIIVVLPFFTSIIVRTYAWMVLLGRNGIVNHVPDRARPGAARRCRCSTTRPASSSG